MMHDCGSVPSQVLSLLQGMKEQLETEVHQKMVTGFDRIRQDIHEVVPAVGEIAGRPVRKQR